MWWDENQGRYRTSLIHKIFYVWCWPAIRWAMFKLPEETAHHLAIRGIWLIALLDRVWSLIVFAAVLLVIGGMRLLALLPGFSWMPELDQTETGPDPKI